MASDAQAATMMAAMPVTQVMPVMKWDSTEFLQTKPYPEPGILTLALRALLEEDMDPTAGR
jgi:hypothetical protein